MPNYQIGKRLSADEIASLGEETVVLARFKDREEIGSVELLRTLGDFGDITTQIFSVEVRDVVPDDPEPGFAPAPEGDSMPEPRTPTRPSEATSVIPRGPTKEVPETNWNRDKGTTGDKLPEG